MTTSLASPGLPGRKSLHAHLRVYEQARELCSTAYEELMRVDEIRRQWKEKHPGFSERHLLLSFERRYLRGFVPAARAMMAAQLTTTLDDGIRESLYEALVLDGSLVRGRGRPLGVKGKTDV